MQPEQFLLKLDLSNAFNLVSREAMLRAVRELCPSIAAWVEYCYHCAHILYAGDHNKVASCMGVQQGDPLGPLLFSVVLHGFLKELEAQVPDLVLNLWFLDDGTIIGTKRQLLEVMKVLEENTLRGLHPNWSKSLVWSPLPNADFSGLPAVLPTQAGPVFLFWAPPLVIEWQSLPKQ